VSKKKKKPVLQRHIIGEKTVLYEAAITAGFTPAQISAFGSEEELKETLRKIKPGLIAEMESKAERAKKTRLPEPKEPGLKDMVETFNIAIDLRRTQFANQAAMEEMQIQSVLRQKRIRYIQCISIVRLMVPDEKKQLNSQVTVNYKA